MALFKKDELIRKASQNITKSYVLNDSQQAASILKKHASAFSKEKTYDIFLSHSYMDAQAILGLKMKIEEMGYSIYVDWIEDRQLDRTQVTKETAKVLKERMRNCRSLLFATSNNTSNSVWMPWELGYFDGIKGKVAILPILDTSQTTDKYEGQEYLGLYPYVSQDRIQTSQKLTLWIHTAENVYIAFEQWLKGMLPYRRTS